MVMRKTARRYVVANKAIRKGDKIAQGMLTVKRPGEVIGLEPRYLAILTGRVAQRDLAEDESITWDCIVGGKNG